MKRNGFAPIILVIVVAVLIGVAYFLGTQKNNTNPVPSFGTPVTTPVSNQQTNLEQVAIKSLVSNFYVALANQDGKTLFDYMTPPLSPDDKQAYSWLTGADLGVNAFYRVFLRVKISSPKINNIQKIDDNTFIVNVTDQFQGYSNAGSYVGYTAPQTRNVVLTIIMSGNSWLVDKFTDPLNTSYTGNAGVQKYNGFGQ